MISIASAMKQEEIITLLEAYQGENETFTFTSPFSTTK